MKANSREEIRSLRTFQMLISLWKFQRLWSTLHFRNSTPLKIDWKINLKQKLSSNSGNIRVETLPCARIFRLLHTGHYFTWLWFTEFRTVTRGNCLTQEGSELAMALDLSGKRLSCPTHPEMETQALFIGCACFPSYEINKLVEK